ncbi:cell division protein FtsQ/DivIB [Massilia rubra]|uniref:Cell division protein FtsQ n=1 Tax=Massilia rubra TaxID=2607910 RepID=A0ABX0LLT9_9BURK|nr:cell division protein FtsQ/DivIB [Massilia rubra]NHZ35270.1 FtsQ-type POTRA domain-containing protein [Massilia rubra]
MWHDVRSLNATASGLMAAVVIACLASGVWWLSQLPMFTLRTVRVDSVHATGLQHVNKLTLRAGVVGRIKGNFFTTNLEQVRTAFEAVPWVRRATVRREWPDQLIVEVEEHEALGTWGEDGRLLSVKGDVFTANLAEADEDHPLPALDGPEGSEKEVLARFIELRAMFAPIALVPEKLDLSNRYAWTVKLDNGMSVALGREQDKTTFKQRVQRLVGIYPQLANRLQDGIDTIDMRYQNGLALSAAALVLPDDPHKPVKAVAKKAVKPNSRSTSSKIKQRQ